MKAPYTKGQRCPTCGRVMKVRGSRKRGPVITMTGETVKYQQRIYRCDKCESTHTELPCELLPRLRYETDVIQAAVEDGPDDGIIAENSTIHRWRFALMAKLEESAAAARLVTPLNRCGERWLAETVKKIIGNGIKHTLFAYAPSAGAG